MLKVVIVTMNYFRHLMLCNVKTVDTQCNKLKFFIPEEARKGKMCLNKLDLPKYLLLKFFFYAKKRHLPS